MATARCVQRTGSKAGVQGVRLNRVGTEVTEEGRGHVRACDHGKGFILFQVIGGF